MRGRRTDPPGVPVGGRPTLGSSFASRPEAARRGGVTAALASVAAVALLLSAPAGAVEGGLGAYLLGSRDSLAGIAPPPGTYLTTDFIYIDGNAPTLAIGGVALTDVESSAWLAKINATHSLKGTLWGGRPVVTFTLPIVSGTLDFGGELESGLSGGLSDDRTGLGDLTVTPMLGWSRDDTHWQIGASIFAPTGYYETATVDVPGREVQALSFGKNRWAFMPTAAFTWLDPDTGREISATGSVTFSLENDATDYQTAPEAQMELAALQHLPSGLALGLQGYAYQQLGDDSGAGADAIRDITGAESLQGAGFRHRPDRDVLHENRRNAGFAENEIHATSSTRSGASRATYSGRRSD